MLLFETNFTKWTYFKIPNFNIYYTKHPDGTAHGSTAIVVRSSLKHHELPNYKNDYIQATSMVIEDWKGHITITSIYSPPRHSISKEQYERFFNTLENRFIAGGYYNKKHINWESGLTNLKERALSKTMFIICQVANQPTGPLNDTANIPDH